MFVQICEKTAYTKGERLRLSDFISFASYSLYSMKHKAADRVNELSESETLAMAQRTRELRQQGLDIISLSLGEPDFDTPAFICDAAKKAMDEGFTHYPPVAGYPELRQAICDKLKRDNNLSFEPSQVVVSTGAKQTLMNLVLSLVNPGDEVLLPAPYWVSYRAMVEFAKATPVFVPTSIDHDFKCSPAQWEHYITDRTKLIIYSSPCNPSGTVYTRDELEALARVVEKHPHVLVISDEIYEHITFEGEHQSLAQFDFIADRVITVNGVSKGFAMTGWRIGYMAGPKWVADAVTKIQGQFTSGANSIAQKAAQAAMEADPSALTPMVVEFEQRKKLVIEKLQHIPGLRTNDPQGAFYIFPDVSAYFGKQGNEGVIQTANDLCMYLLYEAKIALVPGEAFGNPNCLRLSYATSEAQLTEALDRMKSALQKLRD